MKKVFLLSGALALVLMGAGCEKSYEYNWGDDTDSYDDYEYTWGDYDSIPDASIDVPTSVAVGEEFDIVVDVTHDSSETQLLHSIDIGSSYLSGIAITGSTPEYTEEYLLDDGTYTHTLLTDVPVGGTTVTFHAAALESGNWKGAFDVCFDDGLNCSFYTISTYVQ